MSKLFQLRLVVDGPEEPMSAGKDEYRLVADLIPMKMEAQVSRVVYDGTENRREIDLIPLLNIDIYLIDVATNKKIAIQDVFSPEEINASNNGDGIRLTVEFTGTEARSLEDPKLYFWNDKNGFWETHERFPIDILTEISGSELSSGITFGITAWPIGDYPIAVGD
jgi:hypothetical protein